MKKTMKRETGRMMKKGMAFLLALVMCIATFAAMRGNTVQAEAATTEDLKVTGASVRFVDGTVDGIRFAVSVKQTVFDALTDAQKEQYHLLVMPSKLVTGDLEKGETYSYTVDGVSKTAQAADVVVDWKDKQSEGEYYVARVYLNAIDQNYYTTDVTARAYYQDTNGETYSNALERSYEYVADAALNDLKNASEDGYENAVGASYSPYTAAQRNMLLGVTCKINGTWDYIDGNYVSTNADESDWISPRKIRTGTGEYVINASFKTSTFDAYQGILGGLHFGCDVENNSFLILDYFQDDWHKQQNDYGVCIRGYDGSGNWPIYRDDGKTFQPDTWYEVYILINESDTEMEIVKIYYREKGSNARFSDLFNGFTVKKSELPYGSEVRMYVGGNRTTTFDSEVGYNDKYNFLHGERNYIPDNVICTDDSIQVIGSPSDWIQVVDLKRRINNTGNNANFTMSVDITFDEDPTENTCEVAGLKFGGDNMYFYNCNNMDMFIGPVSTSTHVNGWNERRYDSVQGMSDVIAKIKNREAVTFKIVATTSDGKTAVKVYADDILCNEWTLDSTGIASDHILYMARRGVTFSNISITANE